MPLAHKFQKAEYEAREAKKTAGKSALKDTQISSINNVPGIRDALKLLLDVTGIEYKS